MGKCPNCKTPGCKKCGTTHAMWECDYSDKKDNTVLEKIREQYRKTGDEISSLYKKVLELNEMLHPDSKKLDSISATEYFDKSEELMSCKKRLEIARVENDIWSQAREICIENMK